MSLRDLRRVDEAEVRKAGRVAATLVRTRDRCVFRYVDAYDGPPVATSLPLEVGEVVTPAGAVPPFFAGLLPEGRRLVALQRAIKTSADDDLSLLLAVGHDAIGDVVVVPRGVEPRPPPTVAPSDLDATTFRTVFERVVGPSPEDRRGLPGVQPKVSEGMISLPISWGQRPSILKFDPPDFPGLVDNESFFLGLAARAGLSVPRHEVLHDAEGAHGLLIARFDRVEAPDGAWRRVAQEDACQVLGRYPADKYRSSSEEVVTALAAVCGAPRVAARELLRAVVFAYLTCNGDQHGKNLSILQDASGEWWPSPAYDLPSTHPHGDTTMALTIGGRDREDIGREQLLGLAAAAGVPTKAAERVLDEVATAVEAGLEGIGGLPYDGRKVHKLRRAIQYRLDRVR